jgi:hypothetical protein
MVITLGIDMEKALKEAAQRRGIAPEALALQVLREGLTEPVTPSESRDDWERRLRAVAIDCGVALSNEALSSEGLYE